MDFNQANPYLAKLDVRQVIAYGTNRADMVQRIVGPITASVKPLNNRIFMPTQPQYVDTSDGLGDFNPAKAKQLLQASGMTMGSDGYSTRAPVLRPARTCPSRSPPPPASRCGPRSSSSSRAT